MFLIGFDSASHYLAAILIGGYMTAWIVSVVGAAFRGGLLWLLVTIFLHPIGLFLWFVFGPRPEPLPPRPVLTPPVLDPPPNGRDGDRRAR